MYKKIIIYDGYYPTNDGREHVRFKLEPLLMSLKTLWKDKSYPSEYIDLNFKCPAFTKSLKNVFVYKAPYDVRVVYDKNKRYNIEVPAPYLHNDHLPKRISPDGSENNHEVQLFNGVGTRYLYSNKPCEMTLEQPYFHNPNITVLSGCYDIHKWFRPFHPGILNFERKDFEIKRGEPLLYIRFPKDVKIEFRQTVISKYCFSVVQGVTTYKKYVSKQPLENLYKFFNATFNKKTIIKELEKHRIK